MKMAIFITLIQMSLIAAESQSPSREELKKRLDSYIKENKEASTSISPLIDRLNNILSNEIRSPGIHVQPPASALPADDKRNPIKK